MKIYCDGGARGNPGSAAAAFVVEKDGRVFHKEAKYLGVATNNVAEYNALIMALSWAAKNKNILSSAVLIIMDSELVVKQLSGAFKVKKEDLRNLFFTIKDLEKKIGRKIFYRNVERSKNKLADFLVNEELDKHA